MSQLTACANCGESRVGVRVHAAKRGASTAQVACTRCGAKGPLITTNDGSAIDEAARQWNALPAAAVPQVSARAGPQPMKGPGPDGTRDPLELLARMVVSGSYRVPVEGRATLPPLSSADVAGALGMMRDSLAKAAALAVALRAEGVDLARFGRLALQRVVRALRHYDGHVPLQLECPADRWRLRLVLQDAADDLVWPERKRPSAEAARAVKMRKGDYLIIYKIAGKTVQQAVDEGRREFRARLFSHR
ncbi:hypothetical protein M2410_002112 [Stenotrophomonas chelatiphaga]|uniref:hypothetical protein n=1 Tax=Stenotrophomonas chelatiphaga TaxID=517011 RepID=UPI00161BDD50|nr:hypothetical protein [Stenotrophomonas chelatiphaga]MCS4231378.1 hypothetical protein [Stenotrophomonas chelatiphaga]